MKNFIETYDNALTEEECKYIIDYMNTDDRLIPGVVQSGVQVNVKDSWDLTLNLDQDLEVNRMIFKSLEKCLILYVKKHPQLNQVSKWKYHPFYNLQKYDPYQGYHFLHCENNGYNHKRMMAWMFYLNTVTDGGGTYFDNYDLTMDAVEGRGVLWPAYWTHMHKGIVSKTETKYIATGWISYTGVKTNGELY